MRSLTHALHECWLGSSPRQLPVSCFLPFPVLPMDEYTPLRHTMEFVFPGDNRYWMYLLKCVTCHVTGVTPWGIGSMPVESARQMGWVPGRGRVGKWRQVQCPTCYARQQQQEQVRASFQQSDQTRSQPPPPPPSGGLLPPSRGPQPPPPPPTWPPP